MDKQDIDENGLVNVLIRKAKQHQWACDMDPDTGPGPLPSCHVREAKSELEEELYMLGINIPITKEHTDRAEAILQRIK